MCEEKNATSAAVAMLSKAVAYLDIGSGGYLDLGSDLDDEELLKLPSGRHMLAIVGTFGVDGYTPAAVAGLSLEQLLRGARHRIANLSRASVPFEDPLDGPILKALDAALAAPPTAHAAPQPAPIFGDDDHVLVPRGLLGAACSAIDKKRDGVKTLAELRRYTTGDLSKAAPQQDDQKPYAYAVYFPDQPTVELVHDLDELTDDLTNREHQITRLYAAPQTAPQPAVQQGDAEVLLIAAVDEWFAKNTGLGGCSDKDVQELQAIFATHPAAPAAQGDALDTERLDWLTFNISGKALRDIGVICSEHGDARRAIDAARAQAKEGGA